MLLRAANFYSKDLIGSMFKVDFSQCIKIDVVIAINVVIHNDLYRIFFSPSIIYKRTWEIATASL